MAKTLGCGSTNEGSIPSSPSIEVLIEWWPDGVNLVDARWLIRLLSFPDTLIWYDDKALSEVEKSCNVIESPSIVRY